MSSAAPAPGSDRLARRADLPAADGRAHLVGAGGAGMRGLAVLLARDGWSVTGCDASTSARAPEITARGGELLEGHAPEHVKGVGLVVRSAAVPRDHGELEAARERGIPVWDRARALAALVNDGIVAAVSGTHGKTTITAMAALAARAGGVDATGVVGGVVPAWGEHAVGGEGPTVVEADEYEAAFLELDPDLAVVSAVEAEHLESFDGLEGMKSAYRRFAGRAAERLGVLYCADEAGARELGEALDGAAGYGFERGAAYRVRDGGGGRSRLEAPEGTLAFRLAAPGRHNLQNAAAGLAVALRLGADPAGLEDALAEFRGVERRLQELVDADGMAVVDDYAHHPTEVRASLGAVRRAYPGRRVVAVFQPHLFSRTQRFAPEFAGALADADRAVVLPIYAAREEPIPGVAAEMVVEAGEELELVDREAALELVRSPGGWPAVALFMGAGDVTALAHRAAEEVAGRAVGA